MTSQETIFYKVRNCIFYYIGECRLWQYLLRVKPKKYAGMTLTQMISALLNNMRSACLTRIEFDKLRGLEKPIYNDMHKFYSYYL